MTNVRSLSISVAFVGAMFASSALAATVVHDLRTDFSDASNPNGVWAFREGNNLLPSTADWSGFVGIQPAWSRQDQGENFLPAWMQSVADNPLGADGTIADVRAGDVFVHSTDNFRGPGGIANVTWTSPIDGIIDILGNAWMARDIGRSNTWEILLNGTSLSSGSLFSGDPFDRDDPFDFAAGSGGAAALLGIAVGIGDVVQLNIAKTSFAGDFVGTNLTIEATSSTVIPLPSSLLLLFSSLAGLGLASRRFRRLKAQGGV